MTTGTRTILRLNYYTPVGTNRHTVPVVTASLQTKYECSGSMPTGEVRVRSMRKSPRVLFVLTFAGSLSLTFKVYKQVGTEKAERGDM